MGHSKIDTDIKSRLFDSVGTGQDYLYSIWVNVSHIEKQGHAK